MSEKPKKTEYKKPTPRKEPFFINDETRYKNEKDKGEETGYYPVKAMEGP